MTPEEAKRKIDEQNAELVSLESKVAALAQRSPGPVMLAITRALVEMVCGRDGPHFATLYKTRFYRGVLRMLAERGIV